MSSPSDAPPTNRPYAPPSNVIMVLKRLQSRNLPERIDPEYLRDCGVPDGTVTRTLFGLRFLGLVTEAGAPTQELRAIGNATVEEYQSILTRLIRTAYADVFNVVDPAEDGQERIANVFRKYSPASQRARMVMFFLGMCREAGMPILDTPRQRKMASGPAKAKTPAMPKKAPGVGKPGVGSAGSAQTGFQAATGVHPALDGLIRSLPAPGTPMTKESREQWLVMAGATLGFIYPFKPPLEPAVEDADGGEEGVEEDEE